MDVDLANAAAVGAPIAAAIGTGWGVLARSLWGQNRRTKTDLVAQVNGLRQALTADIEKHKKETDQKFADLESELDAYNNNALVRHQRVMDRFQDMPTRSEMSDGIRGLHSRLDDLFARLGSLRHE